MSRRVTNYGRKIQADPTYESVEVARFINLMMMAGKKSLSQRIFYQAMDIIKEKTKEDGIHVFKKALDAVKPTVEVRSRRVGGMTYQVPREVRSERMLTLAIRWIVEFSRERKEKSMSQRLANELIEASSGQGGAAKRRTETRRMAEANKAFSHYRW